MDDLSHAPSPNPTSEKKLKANRRNASKSTGPRTARGKSYSRLNALKHGILASQAVLTTLEGRAERTAFEELVSGLALDFRPAGAFEQSLVQQIAACIWRQRRLLMFENRAAFQARDNRTFQALNDRTNAMQPLYVIEGRKFEGEDVLDDAGLGLDLPGERDTMRLVRYESTVTRSLRNALAQLRQHQQLRREGLTGAPPNASGDAAPDASSDAQESASAAEAQDIAHDEVAQDVVQEVVVDLKAIKRNQGPEAGRMGAKVTMLAYALEQEAEEDARQDEERTAAAGEQVAKEEGAGAASAPAADASSKTSREKYQTKPNSSENETILRSQQQILSAADTVMKLNASLTPKRRPSSD
jgi:hypothetical protein